MSAVGAVVVASVAGLSACLLVPGPARPPREPGATSTPSWLLPALVVAPAAAVAASRPRLAILAVVLGVAALAGWRLVRARRARAVAVATSARVVETCEQVAAELAGGSPPAAALGRAAHDWPSLSPVAEAIRVGADVAGAWRAAANEPGAADLRLVGAAWQVSHRTGAGLAEAIERVGGDLRAAQATRRIVEGELASARATSRLVALLPVLALGMGSGAGGDPWGFLLGTVPGLACLAAGLAIGMAGLAWVERIARDVDRAT